MKTINWKSILLSMLMVFAVSACGDDDPDPGKKEVKPVADFTFEVEDGTGKVTFTNTSKDATSYEWNFGDEVKGTSTDKNPEYTYEVSGDYEVKLTALDAEKNTHDTTKTVTVTVEVPKETLSIAIDAEFDDWADIPVRDEATFSADILKEIKVVATDEHIYVYMRGGKELYQKRNYLYIDMDNDPSTGNQGKSEDLGYAVHDPTIPGDAIGFDVSRQLNGFFVWGCREEPDPIKLGWDWIDDGSFIEWQSTVVGEEVLMEWKCDLRYAGAQLVANPVFNREEEVLISATQFAKTVSKDKVRLIVRFRNAGADWSDLEMFNPISVKIGEYAEE